MSAQYIDEKALKLIRTQLWSIAKSKGVTLEDIQDRTGFSYSQVYRIIRGKNNMSVSGLIAVCVALETQPSEIFNFKIEIPKHLAVRKNRK